MNYDHDLGLVEGLLTIDTTLAPPLGGAVQSLYVVGTGAIRLPLGATSEQPTDDPGLIRFNTTTGLVEFNNGLAWNDMAVGGSGVTSVSVTGSTGLSVSGSPITSSGTITLTLDAGLQALSSVSGTGILVSTGTDTWASRTITGTAGNITVADGDGIAANPTINLAAITQAATGDLVKVTVDGYGRVTGNTAVTTADITTLVDNTYVNVSGDTMASGANLTFVGGGEVLGLPSTPSSDTAAASKAYVDSVAAGLSWKDAVQAATTANIDLTTGGLLTVDGYTVVAGDRVLVKNQTASFENGIYVASAGAWVRSTDMDATTPTNEINGAAVFVENGTVNDNTGWTQTQVVTTVNTDPVLFTQFSGAGSYLAGTGLSLTGNVFSLTSPVSTALGGTGLDTSTAANGQILIGNGSGLSLASISTGTGISVTPGAGTITISNTGVTSVTGTANEVEVVPGTTGSLTVGLPNDVTIGSSLTVSGLTPNAALYVGAGGLIANTAALTDGQFLIGSTGNPPVVGSITAGSGITVTPGAGTVAVSNAGVLSFSGGTTGLTPASATTGVVTLGGTLNPANGGTGLDTSTATNGQILIGNGSGLSLASLTAGAGINITTGAGAITINNAGVTSVALTLPSSLFSVTGSPVTTTGTLAGSLLTQTANTIFAGPSSGGATTPTFRALTLTDLATALQLYTENPSAPTAPSAAGANAVAVGSGATATAANSYAQGDGTNARTLGQRAYANGAFATPGDAQHGVYVARGISTTNAFTELFLDGATTRLVIADNSVYTFDILIAARRTDATGGGAGYRYLGVIRKDGTVGSTTFIGAPSKTNIGETNSIWDVRVTADNTTGALKIEVRGENSKTIRWVATIQTTEVTN